MNHISIVESLDALMKAIEHLEQFVDRVENEATSVAKEEEKIQSAKIMPSLRDVLRMTPLQINAHAERLHDALNRLDSALYSA